MRIVDDYKKHNGEKVWCYCINEPKRLVEPTLGILDSTYYATPVVNKLNKNGTPSKKSICYRAASKWKELQIFTDKQECIDAFIEECRVIIDKYDSLIQQTNNL